MIFKKEKGDRRITRIRISDSDPGGRDPILSTQRNPVFLKKLLVLRKMSDIWNKFPRCARLFVTNLIGFIKKNE